LLQRKRLLGNALANWDTLMRSHFAHFYM
jgi:hypothetical protein